MEQLGYNQLVTFESQDSNAKVVYHTNVMMAIGTSVAVVCGASVPDSAQRKHLMVRIPSVICAVSHTRNCHFLFGCTEYTRNCVSESPGASSSCTQQQHRRAGKTAATTLTWHCDVMMAVGTSVAVVCGASVPDSAQRKHLMVRTPASILSVEFDVFMRLQRWRLLLVVHMNIGDTFLR